MAAKFENKKVEVWVKSIAIGFGLFFLMCACIVVVAPDPQTPEESERQSVSGTLNEKQTSTNIVVTPTTDNYSVPDPTEAAPTTTYSVPAVPTTYSQPKSSVYYSKCADVPTELRPLRSGDPGYSSSLDRDGDGVACEFYK